MPEDNFPRKITDKDGRPSVIVYECQSGVVAYITPMSLATLRAVQAKAAMLHPYPDEDDEQARREIDIKRTDWSDWAVFTYAVQFPVYPTKEDVIRAFAMQLMNMRKIAELPEDDYTAIVLNIILTWSSALFKDGKYVPGNSEYARVIRVALQLTPVVLTEATNDTRYYRPVLPEDKLQ